MLLINSTNGNIISSKYYTSSYDFPARNIIVNSLGDTAYILFKQNYPYSGLFRYDPSDLASPLNAVWARNLTGYPYGMVFGSNEN